MDFKKIATIVTIVFTITIGTSGYLTSGFGLISKIDARYAKAAEVKQINNNINYLNKKIDLNQLMQIKAQATQQYFEIKNLKLKHPTDREVQKLYEQAVSEKKIAEAEFAEIKKEVKLLGEKLKK